SLNPCPAFPNVAMGGPLSGVAGAGGAAACPRAGAPGAGAPPPPPRWPPAAAPAPRCPPPARPVCHTPEKSGLPSAVRGVGAFKSGSPDAVLGVRRDLKAGHCAKRAGDRQAKTVMNTMNLIDRFMITPKACTAMYFKVGRHCKDKEI